MESVQEVGMIEVSISYLYRAEDGEQGDGCEPPQARNGWRVRSEAEVNRRPPERSEGCVCGISPQAEGVRTQSRRHLSGAKVETGRGKGAKRLAGPKLRIDRGGMGGGESIDYDSKMSYSDIDDIYANDFLLLPDGSPSNRQGIFYHCIYSNLNGGGNDEVGGEAYITGDNFVIYDGCWYADAQTRPRDFMHELGHCLGLDHTPHTYPSGTVPSNANTCMNEDKRETVAYHSYEWMSLDYSRNHWDWA